MTNNNYGPVEDLPRAVEGLWADLYERGFVEIEDVYLVQRWLRALMSVGYKFPSTKNKRRWADFRERGKIIASGKTMDQVSVL